MRIAFQGFGVNGVELDESHQRNLIMLVLTRRVGETIVIDGRIRVTIVEICGNKIRLSVEAPNDIPVERAEVLAGLEPVVYRYEPTAEVPG
jgi:carbon storage regulator